MGVLERPTADAPIENFHLGFPLQFESFGEMITGLVNSKHPEQGKCEISNCEFQTCPSKSTKRELCQHLNDWERNCGGHVYLLCGRQDTRRGTCNNRSRH